MIERDLASIRHNQQKAGDYIRAARNYPEWLCDIEGAKRAAEDWIMEEVIVREGTNGMNEIDPFGVFCLTEYTLAVNKLKKEHKKLEHKNFDELFEKRVEVLRGIGRTKGRKYTKHSEDRLSNFKEEAMQLDLTPLQVWHVLFNKHMRAIEDFLRTEENFGEELVENHLTDALMYLFLLEGLIADKRTEIPNEGH